MTPFDSESCSLRGRPSFEPNGAGFTPGGQFRGPGVESGELFCAKAEGSASTAPPEITMAAITNIRMAISCLLTAMMKHRGQQLITYRTADQE